MFCVLLAVVSKSCVRRSGFRRLPALKTTIIVCSGLGVMVWVSCLEFLERGAGEEVV